MCAHLNRKIEGAHREARRTKAHELEVTREALL
jgi:hypothetical protein